MERLIKDADKLSDTFSVSKDKNGDLVYSYADIVDAIHIVQTEMGITGTTADEASGTISGSVASMKASWQNLVGALSNGEADLGWFIDNFCESALTAIHNLVPRIGQALSGISEVIAQLMPVIAAELPGLMEELLPGVISGATALITGLISALPTILQILIEQIPSILTQIGAALVTAFPLLLETVKNLFGQIWDYIALELFNTSYDFETALGDIKVFFENAWAEIQEVWDSIGQPVFDIIQTAVESAQEIFAEKMPEIAEFVSTCFTDIQNFWNNNLKPCFDAIGNFIETVFAPVFDVVFNTLIKSAVDTAFAAIKNLWEDTLKPVFTGITDFLTGVFTLDFDQALNGILEIATGVFNGILTAIETPMNAAKEIVENAVEFLKEKFNFQWSLPHISLPHFSVSGGKAPWGFGGKGSLPSVSVSWYAKAMDNAMLLDEPTIFGAAGGELLGAGEAGQEVVSGANTLMGMISNAVAEQNSGLVEVLVKILNAITSMDGNMEDSFKNALDGTPFKVNNREFGRLVKAVT